MPHRASSHLCLLWTVRPTHSTPLLRLHPPLISRVHIFGLMSVSVTPTPNGLRPNGRSKRGNLNLSLTVLSLVFYTPSVCQVLTNGGG